jgi:hypothetical protein
LIVVDRKHGNEHVEMGGVFDVATGWILRGFSDCLANRSL